MTSPLSEALRQAAELQKRLWKAYEPIYAALGYWEVPPEHVVEMVVKGVEDAALALDADHERIKTFRARKAIEEKWKVVVPEEDQCRFCGEVFGAPECPECLSRIDEFGVEQR
jgi:hypothetical protein